MLSSPAHYRAGSVACYARLLSSARIASFSSSSGASSFLSTRSNCMPSKSAGRRVQEGPAMTHLVDEQEKVAVARVQMRCRSRRQLAPTRAMHPPPWAEGAIRRTQPTFNPKRANVIKVIAVEVRVYPEEPAEERTNCVPEIAREGDTWYRHDSYVRSQLSGFMAREEEHRGRRGKMEE